MTPDSNDSMALQGRAVASNAESPRPPAPGAEAECRLLLLPDGRILAHNLTPELHQMLAQHFPEA